MQISEQHATHRSPGPAVWRLLSVTAVGLAVCAGAMALVRTGVLHAQVEAAGLDDSTRNETKQSFSEYVDGEG